MVDAMNPIDWTLPAADILAELLAQVWQPTNTEVTIGMIRDTLGFTPEQYGLVRGTLERAINELIADDDPVNRMKGIDLKDARDAMLSRGISLSDANRQATIDELAHYGQWPDEVRDVVKALGGVWVGRWSVEGFDAEPTLSQVESRKAEKAEEIHRQKAKLAGVRFGEQFALGGDPAATMAAIWEAI